MIPKKNITVFSNGSSTIKYLTQLKVVKSKKKILKTDYIAEAQAKKLKTSKTSSSAAINLYLKTFMT